MSSGLPELGSKISLISKADIRYEGRLYTVDPQECTIALSSVRSFGTEDRDTQFQIAPQSQIYDYILFRGSDIKDIRVVNSLPHPNDPAIMQVQLPNGQHVMPHFSISNMNAPPQLGTAGAYGNPFGGMGGIAGMNTGGTGGANSNMAPGSVGQAVGAGVPTSVNPQGQFMMGGNCQQPHQQQQQKPQISRIDMLNSASRSTTPMSLISRKSPLVADGMNNQAHQQPHHQQTQNRNNQQVIGRGRESGNYVATFEEHKRQDRIKERAENNANNYQRNGGGNENYRQRDRRDSGRNENYHPNQQHNQMQQHHDMQQRNYNNHNNRNNGGNNNRPSWSMQYRGQPNNNPNNMRNRGGGRGRMPNQGYRPMVGNMMGMGAGGTGNKPRNNKTTIKFEQDFDFEQANNKFEELRLQLSKLKVGEEPKTTEQSFEDITPPTLEPHSQMNGETDKKDDSGNETGAGDHEPEDEEITVGYDKTKSFFDNISCEAAQDRTKNKKNDWRQERKLNSETFGVSSTRRGSYRGRNNYYNRGMGNYGGGYNSTRGYRTNNYRNRNNGGNNNRMGGPGGNQNRNNNAGTNTNKVPPNAGPSSNNTNAVSGNGTPTPTVKAVALEMNAAPQVQQQALAAGGHQ